MTPRTKTAAATIVLAGLTLGAPTVALGQEPPPGLVVAGKLPKKDARAFLKRQLPQESTASILLGDERGSFYRPRAVRVEPAKRCQRFDESTVNCRFRLRLHPDKAHRKAGWFPIRCHGINKVVRLSNGGIGGDMGDYRCVSVIP